ncbi:MAG: hypothetical protein ACOC8K_05700 [Gemmatimonadota bacterium]
MNYKDHPKIPDYDLVNIPRDPGTTWVWNLGFGVGRSDSEGSCGIDLVFEPIRTETRAVADELIQRPDGGVLLPGDRTVENDFDFGNARVRMGGSRQVGPFEPEVGLQVHSVFCDLVQRDRIEGTTRFQEEHWFEWSPTWGARVDLERLEVSYQGRFATGTGRPGVVTVPELRAGTVNQAAWVDFVPAPSGPLTLDDARVWSHRLEVRIPLG